MYVGLAEWLAENLRRFAEDKLEEKLLVFTTIFRADTVLAPMLLVRLDSGATVWELVWRECLAPRLPSIIAGCGEGLDLGDCDEFEEAMSCIYEKLKPVIEEVTPWKTLEELAEKARKTAEERLRQQANNVERSTKEPLS